MRAAIVVTLLALVACGKSDPNAPPPPEDRPVGAPPASPPTRVGSTTTAAPGTPAEAARALFAGRCATCHGPSGHGDGIAARAMTPPPRDYRDAAWQASVTDADLAKVIVAGGAATGRSASMPANPDLAGKPEVVAELVALIRGFGTR